MVVQKTLLRKAVPTIHFKSFVGRHHRGLGCLLEKNYWFIIYTI